MAWTRPGRGDQQTAHGASPADSSLGVRARHRSRLGMAVCLVLLALVIAGFTVHVPYVIMSPGPAVNTLGNDDSGRPLISVGTARSYPTTGSLDFTTVSVRGGPAYPVTAFDVALAKLTPHHEVLPADVVYPPDASAEQVKSRNTADMQASQETAAVVALRALGHSVAEKVIVAAVPTGSPAAGLLRADDVVTKVDGVPTATSAAARAAIRAHKGGERVVVTVQRAGRSVDVPLTTTSKNGTTLIGVLLTSDFTLPVDVTISAGDVGGPSAGTMFALGVYDKLTPGALTGGKRIAGTGALGSDGTVEPIGGIAEKMVAAREAGAEWFLAPQSNCAEVVGNVPDGLHVARMATFAEAVKAVTAIGAGAASALQTCG